MGPVSSRDGRRQSRLIQGTSEKLKIWSINHHKRDENTGEAQLRLDAVIDLSTGDIDKILREEDDSNHDAWFSAYVPEEEDG